MDRTNYVVGKFLLADARQNQNQEDSQIQFYVNSYKLLLQNKDSEKQFDDEANSKWVEF